LRFATESSRASQPARSPAPHRQQCCEALGLAVNCIDGCRTSESADVDGARAAPYAHRRPPRRKETSDVRRSTTATHPVGDDPGRTASAPAPGRGFRRQASRRRSRVVSDPRATAGAWPAASPPASPQLAQITSGVRARRTVDVARATP
jgi:hypothetical protein